MRRVVPRVSGGHGGECSRPGPGLCGGVVGRRWGRLSEPVGRLSRQCLALSPVQVEQARGCGLAHDVSVPAGVGAAHASAARSDSEGPAPGSGFAGRA